MGASTSSPCMLADRDRMKCLDLKYHLLRWCVEMQRVLRQFYGADHSILSVYTPYDHVRGYALPPYSHDRSSSSSCDRCSTSRCSSWVALITVYIMQRQNPLFAHVYHLPFDTTGARYPIIVIYKQHDTLHTSIMYTVMLYMAGEACMSTKL